MFSLYSTNDSHVHLIIAENIFGHSLNICRSIGKCGSGALSDVFEAIDANGNKVAIKSLKVFFKEETLLILFPLRQEGGHFLEKSKHVYLRVNGIDGDMKIEIPLETFLNYPVSQSLN